MTTEEIRAKYEETYGVKTMDYNGEISQDENIIAVEICENGTVFEHGIGGVNYIKIGA